MISTSLVDLLRARYATRVCDAVRAVLLALILREMGRGGGDDVAILSGRTANSYLFSY